MTDCTPVICFKRRNSAYETYSLSTLKLRGYFVIGRLREFGDQLLIDEGYEFELNFACEGIHRKRTKAKLNVGFEEVAAYRYPQTLRH